MDTLTIGLSCGCVITVIPVKKLRSTNLELAYSHFPCTSHSKSDCIQDIIPARVAEVCHFEFKENTLS